MSVEQRPHHRQLAVENTAHIDGGRDPCVTKFAVGHGSLLCGPERDKDGIAVALDQQRDALARLLQCGPEFL